MAAGNWTFTNSTRTNIENGTFDLDSDSFKVALLASTSNIAATSTTFAGVTGELSTANGYTAGGITVSPLVLTGTTSVALTFGTNPVWTVVTANLVARFAVLYEVSGNVVAYCLLDSTPADVTVTPGNTLTISGTVETLA